MQKKYHRIRAGLIFVLATTGCASIFHGTDQALTFTSTPDSAEVLVDGLSQGNTPLTVKLKKNRYSSVMVKKTGYRTQIKPLGTKYDAIALLNVFWDCSTTDLITGAVYEYEPGTYNFNLVKEDAPVATQSEQAEQQTN